MTLLATTDSTGAAINTIDGSRWDPWARKLIFTTENVNAPTYAATPDYPSTVTDVSGALGRGGYEGVALDSNGNVMIVEDIGGANKGATTARIPNSFLYRYVPETPGDLENGKLQVLQVLSNDPDHHPITQATQTPLHSPDQLALHVYGSSFETNWVTIHDTAVDGHTPFNANALAKATANNGTPFKRPENGRFRPGTGSASSTSTRPATRTPRARRTSTRAAGARSSSSARVGRAPRVRVCRSSTAATGRGRASTTRRSSRTT